MIAVRQHAGSRLAGCLSREAVAFVLSLVMVFALAFVCAIIGAGQAAAQAADKAYGEYLASECAGCHRPTGPQVGGVRVIHGMDHDPFVKALKEYRDKTRANNVMQNIAGKLQDDDIAALAAYYSSLAK